MKQKAILAAAAVLLFIAGFGTARTTTPTKTVAKVVTVEKTVEVAAKEKESASVQTTQADIRSITRWRIHYVAKPDGTVETTASGDTGRSSERAAANQEAKRETEIKYVDREKLVDRLVIKETRRPDWTIEARVGGSLSGAPHGIGPFIYGGAIGRRLFAGLSAGVYASTASEVGLLARLEF